MVRYAVAVLSVATALIINQLLNTHLVGAPAMLFLCALMFSAWYGGVKPSLLAMPLAVLAFTYYFVTPVNSWSVDAKQIPRLLLFVVSALFVISLSAAQKRVAEALRHARDVLAGTVEQLRQTNEALRAEIAERKNAETMLHAKEQEFRAIVENAPDLIIRYDREFRRTYVNPAVAAAYGLPVEALTGKPVGSVVPDERLDVTGEIAQTRQRIAGVFDTGKSCEFEMTWTLPGGRKHYSSRLFPELDFDGSVINVLGIARDITERRIAEGELKKEKEILEKIFENIPVMIGFVGEDGRVKLVNREWERAIGWTLTELREQNLDIFTEAYPDPSYRQEILDFVAAAIGEWVDLKIKVRDGRVIDAACAVVRLSDGTKVAIAQDITERKQAEEKIKQSESQLAEAQHLAHVGSWNWDLQSKVVNWSAEVYRIFGVDPQAFNPADEKIMEFIHPEDQALVTGFIESSLKTQGPLSFYYRILRPDGEERVIHTRGDIVSDAEGNPVRIFGTAQDVTERRQAEAKLRQSETQLRALSAGLESAREEEGTRIARELHDELGSALTSLRWSLDEIDSNLATSAGTSDANRTRRKIAAMTSLVEGTLNTVRRISSELRPTMLDDLGLAAAIEWQAQQFQARTGINCNCDCSVENLELSREQSTAVFRILQEALTNILRHAQATNVDIKIEKQDGHFALSVRDNGKGIAEREKLGILGMRERAHLIGAEIQIKGARGKGTLVNVRVPIAGSDRVSQ